MQVIGNGAAHDPLCEDKYVTILTDELRKGGNAQCISTKILKYRQVHRFVVSAGNSR